MVMEPLQEFVVFSKYLNISAAARELNMSQPTLSKHMADLEKELGIKLIDHGHEMRLTSAGKVFLDGADDILYSFNQVLSKCRAVAHRMTNTILVQDNLAFSVLKECLAHTITAIPEIGVSTEITFVPIERHTAIDAVSRGIVDVGYLSLCSCTDISKHFANQQIIAVPILKDKLWVHLNPKHPLVQKAVVSFSDLQDVPILIPANKIYDDWRNVLTDIFAKNDITPKFSMRVLQTASEIALVKLNSEALITISVSHIQDHPDSSVTKELVGDCNELTLYAIYTADNSNPLVPLFVEQMGAGFVDEQSCEPDCPHIQKAVQ